MATSDRRPTQTKARARRIGEVATSPAHTPLRGFALVESSQHGVTIRTLDAVQAKSGFTEADWATILDMTPRTLQRTKQKRAALDTARSERVLLIDQMLTYGQEVFGDKEAFALWLAAPSWPFGGKRPIELLNTATGVQLVYDELGRIEHGIYA